MATQRTYEGFDKWKCMSLLWSLPHLVLFSNVVKKLKWTL